jgi:hypothetical protein
MKQIQVFKTSNKAILATKDKINDWVKENNYEIHQLDSVSGDMVRGEYEIIIMVLYSPKEN